MPRTTRHRLTTVAAGIAVAVVGLGLGLTSTPTVEATPPSYVALGDSYASGVGTRSYDSASGECYRSPHAYPVLDAQRIGAALTSVACSGATVASLTSTQLSALSSSTRTSP